MRAFLAIELPDDVRTELTRAQQRLKDALGEGALGWTPPANWHLTLVFLGQIADGAPFVEAARRVAVTAPPLDLRLGPLGTFGDRVVWAGLDGPGRPGLVTLAGELSRACAALGVEVDDRPYSPHITLGRTRDDRRRRGRAKPAARSKGKDVVAAVRGAAPPAPLEFTAREVVLFESKLGGPHPATYVAHAHVPLAAPR